MIKPNWRLKPSIFNPRWYPLTLTTRQIIKIIELYFTNSKKSHLVDFGCGDMPYKELFEPVVDKYIGLDLAYNPLAELYISPNGQIQIDDNFTDVVLSTQVLEHVENPQEYLSESFRILKDNGILVLSTHGYWIYHPTPHDYWRWTSAGLQKIIKQAGFEIIYFKGLVSRPAFGIQLLQDSLLFKIPKFLEPLLAFPFQILIFLFDKLLASQKSRDVDASIFIVVCRAKKK